MRRYRELEKNIPIFLHGLVSVKFSDFDTLLSSHSPSLPLSLNKCSDASLIFGLIDDNSARGQPFQLTSLSLFSNQHSYRLEEDTHMYTHAQATKELTNLNLVFNHYLSPRCTFDWTFWRCFVTVGIDVYGCVYI